MTASSELSNKEMMLTEVTFHTHYLDCSGVSAWHLFFKALVWRECAQSHQDRLPVLRLAWSDHANVLDFYSGMFHMLIKGNANIPINVIDIYFALNLF